MFYTAYGESVRSKVSLDRFGLKRTKNPSSNVINLDFIHHTNELSNNYLNHQTKVNSSFGYYLNKEIALFEVHSGKKIVIKDVICDAFLQQILTRPKEYDVIATMNLNGDYVSDALAACVGGIGIAPGANISDDSALFEATHGTAPKYAGQDKVNPGSLILSAEMMLRHMGWVEAADLIISSMEAAITDKMVTYDFERLMDGANLVSCSGFAKEMIKRM